MRQMLLFTMGANKLVVSCVLFAAVFGTALLLLPTTAHAAIDDPSLYAIASYDYIPAWGLKFVNEIPSISHFDTVAINYGRESNMDILVPNEITSATARMYYLEGGTSRQFEYAFYDDSHFVPAAYTWTKAGQYEVDIYGSVGTSSLKEYLTTMQFTVTINGGPAPTCTLSISPDTIYPKEEESALLTWSSTHATEAAINQGVGVVATSGSTIIAPNDTTTYTATFTGDGGSVTCTATVTVPDPVILPLHEKAAALAKQLANQPDAYLWGGKGWDYDLGEFTTPERILSGYTYFNPDAGTKQTGVGVDCSGLITWAFNRSNNPTAGFRNNYIQYVNADGMFRDNQSDSVTETELRPGDTLTFDWNNDGRMDHVAMYVGESGGYDVVNASRPTIGIVGQINSSYKLIPGFKGYRRIHQADTGLTIKTGSPVDIEVTDPDGNTLTASSILYSDEEYVREIPGELYYLELEQSHDGRPQDMIIAPIVKDGSYTIKVIPEAGADSTATYSLSVELDGVQTVVVENETIDTIPQDGFILKLEAGAIQSLDPAIKVFLEELRQTITDLDISSKQRKRNLISNVESALSWFERNRTDQIVRKLKKLQGDINKHVTDELTNEELVNITKQINQLLVLLDV